MIQRVRTVGSSGFGAYDFDTDSFSLSAVDDSSELPILSPGFVDIHTHGAFGIDFMSASEADMQQLCQRLYDVGYEAFLPTTVTATIQEIRRALSILPVHPMVAGFHLEGPFISALHPGAQPKSAIVNPPAGPSDWDVVLEDPRLRLITLAPELPGSTILIARLFGRGVTVSMGHTDATYAQACIGFDHGVRHVTHTYNAMRPLHHREPGSVGFAMTQDAVQVELIYDRLHVSPPAAKILIRCKPENRLIAISDSTMAAGLPSGTKLTMWGLDCIVGEGDVRLLDGTLAGSAITLLDAFQNLATDFGAETAIRACCLNPRWVLGKPWTCPTSYLLFDSQFEIVERFDKPGYVGEEGTE